MQENYNVNTFFSDRIKILITRLNISRKDFAESISASYGNVTDWMSGRSEPSAKAIRSIYEIYNVNPIWLVTGQGELFISPMQMSDTETIYNKVELTQREYDSLVEKAKKYDQIVELLGAKNSDN